jgi:hypothetical protein
MANHRIAYDMYPPERGTRTKMDILGERAAFLVREAKALADYIEGLHNTPCGLTCDGCGTLLVTEGDFAAHFVIRDENYLNLGNCPERN